MKKAINGIPLKEIHIKKIIKKTHHYSKAPFWFLVGFFIAGITIASIVAIVFQTTYKDKAIPGIYVDDQNLGGKTEIEIEKIYDKKNELINKSTFTLIHDSDIATISASTLNIGYNSKLIATQAVSLGKSSNIFSNFFNILSAYTHGITLSSSFTLNEDKLQNILSPIEKKTYIAPVNALFQVENNRVTAFKESSEGKMLNSESAKKFIENKIVQIAKSDNSQTYVYKIPDIILKPEITTDKANSFGIVEPIGEGLSFFPHSIPNRIFNINLASQRVNGILLKPGEEFSFVKHLGDVSKFTGYAQAYVISGGKTVLGDGGGVCQVSTTLFRALLNAGLPITERRAHAYRVSYYESQSPPGLDATVYYPSVDLKFTNDTGNYILIQSFVDLENQMLRYVLYGKKDGRTVELTNPVVTNYIPAPEATRQDDPTLPKGTVKQIDFAAAGATVVFNRIVKRDGKIIINEKYTSRYSPWRAVYLVGTKEG